MCFLSIIIPVYNVEQYLSRCLESVIQQRHFDEIEVLLVDDGSTDGSGMICEEYAYKYVNILAFHKANGGLSDARNYALDYAKGDYLFFLDSDDIMEKHFLADIRNAISEYDPEMICFSCCFEKNKNQYRITGKRKFKRKDRETILDDLLKNKMGNQICFNVYRRMLFHDISFPKGRAYEDIATLYKLILKCDSFVKTNYSYYIYNLTNPQSITKKSSIKNMCDMYMSVNEQVESLQSYFELCGIENPYLKYYQLDKYIYIYLKLVREVKESEESQELKQKIGQWLVHNYRVNIVKFRFYNLKKYVYFFIMLRRGISKGDI